MTLPSALRHALSLLALLAVPSALTAQGFEVLDPALRNVRGVNYVPTYPTLDAPQIQPGYRLDHK